MAADKPCPQLQPSLTKGGKKGMKDHIRRKHETSRVSCPECNRTIKEDTLMAHMEATHSSKKGKGHKCTDCSFESNNRTRWFSVTRFDYTRA